MADLVRPNVRLGSKGDLAGLPGRRLVCPQTQTAAADAATSALVQLLTHAAQQKWGTNSSMSASTVHSGNPAFRRPSNISLEFDCPPRAIHTDIVKVGSSSSRRAAASRASASRPRWAKADARQR